MDPTLRIGGGRMISGAVLIPVSIFTLLHSPCEPPETPLAAPDYNPLMTDGRHWTVLTMLATFLG